MATETTLTATNQQQNQASQDVNAIYQNQMLANASMNMYLQNQGGMASGASYGLTGGAWAASQAMQQAQAGRQFTSDYLQYQQALQQGQTQKLAAEAQASNIQMQQSNKASDILGRYSKELELGLGGESVKRLLSANVAGGVLTQEQMDKYLSQQSIQDALKLNTMGLVQYGTQTEQLKKQQEALAGKSYKDMTDSEKSIWQQYMLDQQSK